MLRPVATYDICPQNRETTGQQGQRLGDLLFRPGAVVQLTLGTNHHERTMGHLPARFGSLVLLEGRHGLLPGPTRRDRRAPGILALPLRLLDPAGGRLGLLPASLHMAPTLSQPPPRLLSRVEHIQTVLQRRLPVLVPLLLHGGDPRLQARPRVRRDE